MILKIWRWLWGYHVHDWNKWDDTDHIFVSEQFGEVRVIQCRRCQTCNKAQLRTATNRANRE